MPYEKKTWVPGDELNTTELNRMEGQYELAVADAVAQMGEITPDPTNLVLIKPSTWPEPPSALLVVSTPLRTKNIASKADLDAALNDLRWQDKLVLGTFAYAGGFSIPAAKMPSLAFYKRGTPPPGIHIIGPSDRSVVFNRGGTGTGYAGNFVGVSYVQFENLTFTNALKGVMFDECHWTRMVNCKVYDTGQEGVHYRKNSCDNYLSGTEIYNTGLTTPGFGEGVYIGTSVNNWEDPDLGLGGAPDQSNRNTVFGNNIHDTTGECVDIKEGTEYNVILNNTLGGSKISGATGANSFVDVKGNYNLIQGNICQNPSAIVANVMSTHVLWNGTGNGNIFKANVLASGGASDPVTGTPVGIYIDTDSNFGAGVLNVVYNDNSIVGAASVSNIPLTAVNPSAGGATSINDLIDSPTMRTFLSQTTQSGMRGAMGAAPNGVASGTTAQRPTTAVLRSLYWDTDIRRMLILLNKAPDMWYDMMGNLADASYNASAVQVLSEAAHAAKVSAGTVDPNALYGLTEGA